MAFCTFSLAQLSGTTFKINIANLSLVPLSLHSDLPSFHCFQKQIRKNLHLHIAHPSFIYPYLLPSPFHWISSLLLLSPSNCVQNQTRFFSCFSYKILSYPSLVPKLKNKTHTHTQKKKKHQRTKNFFPPWIKSDQSFQQWFPSFSFHRDFTTLFYLFIDLFTVTSYYYTYNNRATMDSHIHHHHHQGYQQHQNQPSSGLLRFRSAPSSLLSNLTPFVSEDFGSSSFRELQGNNNKGCSKDLSSMNSHKGVYGGGLVWLLTLDATYVDFLLQLRSSFIRICNSYKTYRLIIFKFYIT